MASSRLFARRGVRRAVLAAVVLHFTAIGSAVTTGTSPAAPAAPALASAANLLFRPWLGLTFLSSSYRFYSPNPGASTLLWLRIERSDGRAEWVEFPRREDFGFRTPYLRAVALAGTFGARLGDPADPGGFPALDPVTEACLASMVRWHADAQVRFVEVYAVFHLPLTPAQAAAGWSANDLRTLRPFHLGRFDAGGRRIGSTPVEALPSSTVAARALPDLRRDALGERAPAALVALRSTLPEPVAGEDPQRLRERIERHVRGET